MESTASRAKSNRAKQSKKKSTVLPTSVVLRSRSVGQSLVLPQDIRSQMDQLGGRLSLGQAKALFFGAPGLGKTASVANLQAALQRPFWWVLADQFSTVLSMSGGFSFRDLFARAQEANAVLVFDDFDCFVRRRDEKTDTVAMRSAIASWLAAVDEFTGDISMLATTNLPQIFEPAILRRFEQILHFKRLGDDEIRMLMTAQFGAQEISGGLISELRSLSPAEIVDLAGLSRGHSDPFEKFEASLQQRLRILKIAGVSL